MDVGQNLSRVFVGLPSLRGDIGRYSERFDLLEVLGEPGKHPRRPGLRAWRKSVPDAFVFSVVLPATVAALDDTPAVAASMAHARDVADVLRASWWVLKTAPNVTPGPRTLRALEGFLRRVGDDGRRIAWEPRGLWNDDDTAKAAQSLGLHLVRDLAREDRIDDGPVVYTRLRALGSGARVGTGAAERVAERIEGALQAYVVVEGTGASRVRQVLHATTHGTGEYDRALEDEPDPDVDEGDEESVE
jgi:uncharacterized protein YecE (DUF72 family)